MYSLVIFDLDGTLLDTIGDLGDAVNHALEKRGFPLHTSEQYRSMVGHGIRNLVTVSLPAELQMDDRLIDECLTDFKAFYTAHIDDRTRPYAGMPELLCKLHSRGVRLAVASNKFQEGTERLVAEFFPGIPFVAILGNREGAPLKPDPEIVGEVLRRSGTNAADAVLVGDSSTDMKTAANGGIRGIAVAWGYRPMKSCEAYTVVDSVAALERALCPDYSAFFSDDVPSFLRSPVREIFRKVDLASIYSFAGGYPDASTFPLAEMEGLTRRVVEKYGARALQYGGTQGVTELREIISHRYDVPLERVQITTSSQQGIDVCARVFLNPGDVVLTTYPAYLGALQSFRAYRAAVHRLSLEDLSTPERAPQKAEAFRGPRFSGRGRGPSQMGGAGASKASGVPTAAVLCTAGQN